MKSPASTSTVLSHVMRSTREVRLAKSDVHGLVTDGGGGWGGVELALAEQTLVNRSCFIFK